MNEPQGNNVHLEERLLNLLTSCWVSICGKGNPGLQDRKKRETMGVPPFIFPWDGVDQKERTVQG